MQKLLGEFTNETGGQYRGEDAQLLILQKLAKQLTGNKFDIPMPLLKKMYASCLCA